MKSFRFPIAVALTSLALVVAFVGAGALFASNALAFGPFSAGGPGRWFGGADGRTEWQGSALPAELTGLTDVPAGERFAHFRGVRVQLTDKDNKPLTVEVTPGTATTVSATSLTIAGNDGSTHTYTLDDKTIVRGKSAARGTTSTLHQNDQVVIATLNNSSTATAVMAVDPAGFGPHGPFGH
jgi:hypothetical protein